MRRLRLIVVAVLVVGAVGAASALAAAKPKYGYYYDLTGGSVGFKVSKDQKTVSKLSAVCLEQPSTQIGYLVKKHPKFKHGKFSLTTNQKLDDFGTTQTVKLKITGKLSNGKVKGTITDLDATPLCATVNYKAKYLGTSPPMG